MRIGENTVVAIDYTLKDDRGKVIDTSKDGEPLSYLHGVGGIIRGLERELDGKQPGDELHVTVNPEDAYGERDEGLCQDIDRSRLEGMGNIAPGVRFRADIRGEPVVFTITRVNDDRVTVDGNHPLAGANLNFDVKVRDVRAATVEEIAHGHAH